MALRTTIAVECRAQTLSTFNGSGNRIDFLKNALGCGEYGIFLGAQRRDWASGACRATPRTKVGLR
jgi:hypothetical protein